MPSTGPYLLKVVFVFALVIQAIVWSQSRNFHAPSDAPRALSALLKRSGNEREPIADICNPIGVPLAEQCAHVTVACPASDTVLSLSYIHYYFCASPALRPAVFAALVLWLTFLFSTLGISASDFFCPNLASLSALLGLDENVAGVTFLAIGNGSPDLFSTFSAMRAGAGALAMGELLGAASFIVSVVVGTMCVTRPFSVPARPFMRDVGFFTVSIALLLVVLWDGRLYAWEAGLLIILYAIYVVIVVVGTWWEKRQYRLKELEEIVRAEYAEEAFEPYRDEPSDFLAVPISPMRVRSHSTPAAPTLAIDTVHLQPHRNLVSRTRSVSPSLSRSSHPSPLAVPRISHMPSFSLVGALEFRQVCASLRQESAAEALSVFESPITPYAGAYYHRHSYDRDPFAASLMGVSRRPSVVRSYMDVGHEGGGGGIEGVEAVPLRPRSPRSQQQQSPTGRSHQPSLVPTIADDTRSIRPPTIIVSPHDVPLIETTPASPHSEVFASQGVVGETASEFMLDGAGDGIEIASIASSSRPPKLSSAPLLPRISRLASTTAAAKARTYLQRTRRALQFTLHVLFPTLHNWRGKGLAGKVASVLAAPAVLALTLTLPVHVMPRPGVIREEIEERLSTHVSSVAVERHIDEHTRHFGHHHHRHHHRHHHHHRYHHHEYQHGHYPQIQTQGQLTPPDPPHSACPQINITSSTGAVALSVPVQPVALPEARFVDVVGDMGLGGTERVDGGCEPELGECEYCYDDIYEYGYGNGDLCSSSVGQEEHGDLLMVEDQVQEELHELGLNLYLCAAQLILGPLFCLTVLLSGSYSSVRLTPTMYVATAGVGATCAVLLLWVQERVCKRAGGRAKGLEEIERWYAGRPAVQMIRCAAGFCVSVVWIMAIADEVVGALKTFGHIFGLSDALIGLTIFAIGNSLADFVANISVAQFAPVMAFSACFGGPMLNILLGVGGSGLMVTRRKRMVGPTPSLTGASLSLDAFTQAADAFTSNSLFASYYPLNFSVTLLVSAISLLALLLATLIIVPLNNFHLSRAWGIVLIVSYFAIMAVNVGFEVCGLGGEAEIE